MYWSIRHIPRLRPSFNRIVADDAHYFQSDLDPYSPITKYSIRILLPRNTWFSSLPEGGKLLFFLKNNYKTTDIADILLMNQRERPTLCRPAGIALLWGRGPQVANYNILLSSLKETYQRVHICRGLANRNKL